MAIVNVKQFEDYILQAWDIPVNDNWYNGSYIEVGSTDTETGEFNTSLIVEQQGVGTYAASICESATDGGKTDWYLPSIDELVVLYENGIITGATTWWSSTEIDGTDVYILDSDTGDILIGDKSATTALVKVRKEYTSDYVTIERMKLQSKNAPILRGGENNADEDVYKMLGGINGISKNSKIISNE
jgi:hypothetical protein